MRRGSIVLGAAVAVAVPGTVNADGPVRFSGVVASSYEARARTGPEADVEIRLKTRRVDGVRAVAKIEARYFRDSVELEDGYLDYRLSDRLKIQLGLNKKRLGLEYEQSRRERVAPERSEVYQKLEVLGIVGRQLNLRVVGQPRPDVEVAAAVGTNGSRDVNATVHARRSHGPLGYGAWGLVEAHRVDKGYILVWAQVASVWLMNQRSRVVLEVLAGVDSERTSLTRMVGTTRRTHFAAPKLELARRFGVAHRVAVEPFVQAAWIVHDVGDTGDNTVQVVGGLNTHVRGIVLAVTATFLNEADRADPTRRVTRWPNVYVEAKHHF